MQKGAVYNTHMTASERERWLARRVEKLEWELRQQRALKEKARICPECFEVVITPGGRHGRPRLYCSDACRHKGKLRCNKRLVAAKREAERGR